ncbi:XRE family transcriptional regulator [Subtercola vilae]|uniref:ImmA/IrrE family metallo-endopeptidase n=1 Tax=Subtercola vilae TaxID=2056433 RepID=A0A4T2BJY5_9MICO|nr:XRE family transcriptional regulator [Subtercola vilae]TIH30792.1 ImmA/IrrE family metallo-endopeptidase [Subtercola vilae]
MILSLRPERILAVRDLLGETLQNLASSAGISQSYLSEIAAGTRPFTIEHAEKIAAATGFPIEFFHVDAPAIGDTTLQFRKLKSSKAKTTRKAVQYFREASRMVQAVAPASGLKTASLPYVNEPSGGVLDENEIEHVANAVRTLMQLGPADPVPNATRAIERLGIVVIPVLLDPTDEVRVVEEGHFGISHGDDHGVPLVGYFPGSSPDRDRFTLGHELGHILLHSHRSSEDPEREANRFAGALLMPKAAARSELHSQITLSQLARVKAQFGISIQALIMRAAALHIIDQQRQRSLFVQLSARGWRQNEPVEVQPEHPILMRRLLELSLPDDPSSREIEKATGLPRAYVRAIAPSPPRRTEGTGRLSPLRA